MVDVRVVSSADKPHQWLAKKFCYGRGVDTSNENRRWAQKPMYTPTFTHHIRS